MHPILAQRWRLGLFLLLFLQAGLLTVEVLRSVSGGGRRELWLLVLPLFAVHAFSCLASWYVCRAQPLGATPPERLITAQLGSALLASALVWGLGTPWSRLLRMEELFEGASALILSFAFFLYSLTAALHYLFMAVEASKVAEAKAIEMRLLAREAELQVLRSQLDPHFLFNSLNSISALVTGDPKAARAMCLELADFLRRTLQVGSRRRISLADELRLARGYLAVERVRFGDRLRTHFEVEVGCEDRWVPPLILQPLIENAVRHGIAHCLEGGKVSVVASRSSGLLRLEIANPCDPDRRREAGEGVGLANVRRRLEAFGGRRARLTATERGGRFEVVLWLPEEEKET